MRTRSIRWSALHPVLFSAAFVLQPALSNDVEPPGFVRALLVTVLTAGIAIAVLSVISRSWAAGALLATAGLLLVTSHGPLEALLVALRDSLGTAGATVGLAVLVVLVTWALLGLGLTAARHRFRGPSSAAIGRPLTIFGIALIVVVLAGGSGSLLAWVQDAWQPRSERAARSGPDRDIYLILLDGYPRADELRLQFGIDNSTFLAALQERGFDVAADSHSNYTYSALTFVSMFELGYVHDAMSGEVHDAELRDRLRAALRDGPAIRALHEDGYEVVATSAGWEHTTLRGRVDRYLDRPELSDLERQLLQRTWIPDLAPVVPPNLFFAELASRTKGVLHDAIAVAGEQDRSQPVFGFIHVPSPHLPMAFGPDGDPAPFTSRQYGAGRPSEFGLTDADFAAAFAISLEELNRRVLEAVDAIWRARAALDRPKPVIVLMSDHGYNGDSPVHPPSMLNNFFAASTPGAPGLLADAATPVNLIPTLLNAYGSGVALETLPDRYFVTDIDGQRLSLAELQPES